MKKVFDQRDEVKLKVRNEYQQESNHKDQMIIDRFKSEIKDIMKASPVWNWYTQQKKRRIRLAKEEVRQRGRKIDRY